MDPDATHCFDAFISHRRADGAAFAEGLRRRLEQAHRRLPLERQPLRVYVDKVYARATEDFYRDEIQPALLGSRWLIVLATPSATRREGTDWMAREIAEYEAAHGIGRIRVVRASGRELAEIPHQLIARMPNAQDINLTGLLSLFPPQATREDWLTLVATLFDLPDSAMPGLRRLEQKARANRLSLAAGAIAGGAVFATGLSAFALYRSAEALRLVDQSASVLGAYASQGETKHICNILEELWTAGATKRTNHLATCAIANALDAFDRGGLQAGLSTLGRWEDLRAASDDSDVVGAEEIDLAQLRFALIPLQMRHNLATGRPLTEPEPSSKDSLPILIDAIRVSLQAKRPTNPEVRAFRETVEWPVFFALERSGHRAMSLLLMKEVAGRLRAAVASDLESGLPDEFAATEYAALMRRIGHVELAINNDPAASLEAASQSVRTLEAVKPTEASTIHQHALGHLVVAHAYRAMGDAAKAEVAVERVEALQADAVQLGMSEQLEGEFAKIVDEARGMVRR